MMQPILILLPVHNRREITRGFVECLCAQSCHDFQLIVIDDGSTDGTADVVLEVLPAATILRGDGSLWWAGSLQKGLDWLASQEISNDALVLMINDDVRFASDYLERAVAVMAGKRNTLVLSRFVDPLTGAIAETGVHADFRRWKFNIATRVEDINCLSTRGLFLHWADVQKIGHFHPRLLPHYLSDYEYTIRAHRKGLKCETSAQLLIVPNHATTGLHSLPPAGVRQTIVNMFSKRTPANPVYLTSFLLLSCGPLWIAPNLLRTWHSAIRAMLRAMLAR